MKQFTQILLLAIAVIFTGCFEKEPQDKIEEVIMYVAHNTGTYYDLFDVDRADPMEGMIIREERWKEWECHSFSLIAGFDYVKGNRYTLLVEKTTLANPPADAYNVKYKLISVLEEIPFGFPALEVYDVVVR